MKIIKADNYQTWYLENNNNAILIDPWLTNTLQPEGSFFIQRKKNNSSCLSKVEIDKVNGIIITAPFEDHLHIESINMLPEIPIYTSNIVKRQLIKKNIQNSIHILSEQNTKLSNLNIKASETSSTKKIPLQEKPKITKPLQHVNISDLLTAHKKGNKNA